MSSTKPLRSAAASGIDPQQFMTQQEAKALEASVKKKKIQPTQRSLKHLRDSGAMAGVVEKWNMHAKPRPIRVDLFGFIDIIAVVPDRKGSIGIQATTGGNLSSRISKVMDVSVLDEKLGEEVMNPLRARAIRWVSAGNGLIFHGWKQNKKTKRWEVDQRELLKTPTGWRVVKLGEAIGDLENSTVQKESGNGNPF